MMPMLELVGARWLDLYRRRALVEPLRVRDRCPQAIFCGSFLVYFAIGQLIDGFHGHAVYDRFFNADSPRVVSDLTTAHFDAASLNVRAAHPLLLVLLNPPAAVLTRFLCDGRLLASLLLSHAAAAFANMCVYWLLRELGAARRIAVFGAAVHALSTTQLALGSIPETASFATAALCCSLLLALRARSVAALGFALAMSFGVNAAMLPHCLLSAPVLWLRQYAWRRYVSQTLTLFCVLGGILLLLFALQRRYYPGINLFDPPGYTLYEGFLAVPRTWAAAGYRASRLLPHLLLFCVVAPVPLVTDAPARITTFMWEQQRTLASYDVFGCVVLVAWVGFVIMAGTTTLLGIRRLSVRRLNFSLLCGAWLLYVCGLFMVFGDDLLLFSFFWQSHLVVFVAIGIADVIERRMFDPRLTAAALLGFVILLAINQAAFVARMLSHYTTALLVI